MGRNWRGRDQFVAVLFLLAVGGCESITGGGISHAEVSVFGEIPEDGGGERPLAGEVEVVLRVFLGGGIGFPVSLSGGNRTVTVPVHGEIPASLGRPSLVPGVYQGVRVVFTSVRADLTSGLGPPPFIGGGTVTVGFGADGSNALGSERSIVLRDGDELEVTIDLRASDWVGLGGASGIVPPAAFEQSVRVETRVRPR